MLGHTPISLALLLVTAACQRVPPGPLPPPATQSPPPVAVTSACPAGVEAGELFLSTRTAPLPPLRRSNDTTPAQAGEIQLDHQIPWNGREYVAFGQARSVAPSGEPGAERLVRAGFYAGRALYAVPGDLPRMERVWMLMENGCVLQPYQRIVCLRYAENAVNVEVVDARTGGPPRRGATLIVREGAYADTSSTEGPLRTGAGQQESVHLSAARERPGTYDVEVRAPGYHPWRVGGIAVRKGPCHVDSAVLRAYLQPRA